MATQTKNYNLIIEDEVSLLNALRDKLTMEGLATLLKQKMEKRG